jgi:UvrD/REP helicase N-terminal domain
MWEMKPLILSLLLAASDSFNSLTSQALRRDAITFLLFQKNAEDTEMLYGLVDSVKSIDDSEDCTIHDENGSLFSKNQLRSIRTKCPAMLLTSGPGTGKTHTLASRVAYLLTVQKCPPHHIVILSFSNRDADALKQKALDQVFEFSSESASSFHLSKDQLSERLWGGTIHKFASNILRVYGTRKRSVRVLSDIESKRRIDYCLRHLVDGAQQKGKYSVGHLQRARSLQRDALMELRQSRDVLLHQISRCFELWKESAQIPPPSIQGIQIHNNLEVLSQERRDSCLELATRLGISRNVAYLAWSTHPLYQVRYLLSRQ